MNSVGHNEVVCHFCRSRSHVAGILVNRVSLIHHWPMETDRWARVKDIFEAVVSIDEESRERYLRILSEQDDALAKDVHALLSADKSARNFIESRWLKCSELEQPEQPLLRPKDVLCQRFEIVRLIGSGGMGEVYEAEDHELDARIAIKTIRSEIASNSAILTRFRQEVRIARRITHPNVCRTFEIQHSDYRDARDGQVREIVFLTMEYLAGDTLAEVLKCRGRLPNDEILHIARQVAAGLNAAHELGVVHRDVKPGNIILVPCAVGSRAVITDFGLARFVPTPQTPDGLASKHAVTVLGTPGYMAPEQAQGASISPATDIYALGLVILEMATGAKGVLGPTQLSESLPKHLKLDIQPGWTATIVRCLQIRPENRFQSALEVIAALDKPQHHPATFERRMLRVVVSRRWLHFLALIVITLALWSFRSPFFPDPPQKAIPVGATVYLAAIHNESGEPLLNGITDLLRNQLSQSAHFNLLDAGRASDTLQQMMKPPDAELDETAAREVAMRNGAARVILGALSHQSGKYELKLRIQEPDNVPQQPRRTWEKSWLWQLPANRLESGTISNGALEAVREGGAWIREQVGESVEDIRRGDAPPEEITTNDWNALTEFTNAERFVTQYRRDAALQALRNAVTIDPGFAIAYGMMGDILLSLGRAQEGYLAYEAALTGEAERRITRRERDRIRGMYALDTMDFSTAEQAFRDYAAYYDHDYLGWFYRGYPLVMLGRTDEAIGVMQRADAIDPTRVSAPEHLARFFLLKGDFSNSEKWITELRNRRYEANADYVEGLRSFLQGKYNESEHWLELSGQDRDPYGHAFALATLGRLYAETNRKDLAIKVLQQARDEAATSGDKGTLARRDVDLAYLQCQLHNFSVCLTETKEAANIESSPDMALQVSSVLGLAARDAPSDFLPTVRLQLLSLKKMPIDRNSLISQLASLRVSGEAKLLDRKWMAAVDTFRKADSLDAPAEGREYLGRALLLASTHAGSRQETAKLRSEAAAAYARIALRQAFVWYRPIGQPPGFFHDERRDYFVAKDLSSALSSSPKISSLVSAN